MAAKNLSDVERQYFARKAGNATPQEPLNDIKRRYFMNYLTAVDGSTFSDLETQWKIKFITDNGGTIVSIYDADLWKQMVIAISKVPVKQVNANKMTFYLNAP
jgi:hypothetical protein